MRARAWILVAAGTLAAVVSLVALAAVGCGSRARSVSDSDYLLGLQHETWDNAVATLKKAEPNLNIFRALHTLLVKRTPRRVKKDYQGANKDQVLAKLESIGGKYDAEVASKMDFNAPTVQLKPGATIDQVREAFEKLQGEYQEFRQLTAE